MPSDNLMPQSSASVIKHFMLRSSTTGQGLTGKVHSDFSGKYNIAGGAEVTLSFSSGSAGDAYSSGKIVPLGLGKYAWHVPNAVFASLGNVSAVLSVTDAIDVHCEWLVVAAVRDTAAFGANTTAPATPTNVSDARDAILAKLPESGRAATPADVSPTIDFEPSITVNPTELSAGDIAAIRVGLPDVDPGLEGGLPVLSADLTVAAVLDSDTKAEIRNGLARTTDVDTAKSDVLSAIAGLNNLSALANIYGSPLLEIPDSTATDFSFTLVVRDNEGKLVALDVTPTITAENAAGTNRSGNLSAVTTAATGRYEFKYSVASTHPSESLRIRCSGTVSAEGRYVEWVGSVVDYDTVTTLNAVKTKVDAIDLRLPSDPADQSQLEVYIDGAVASIQGSQQSAAAAALSAYDPPTNTEMVARTLPTADYATATGLTAVLTKIRKFFQLTLRKDAAIATDNATELTELNANGGTGGGGYLNTTASQEATVDRGNAAWTTGGGSGGAESALMLSTTIASVTSQNVLVLTEGTAENDAYNGMLVVFTDSATATQKARAIVSGYVGSSKTLTLANSPTFEVASGDSIAIIAVGASGTTAVTLTLGATIPLEIGEVTGLTEPLVIGDDYTEEVGRRIPITLTDANGDAVAVTYGTHSLATDCSIKMLFQPEGRNTTRAAITGTCTFVAAVGETPAFLWLTLPRSETTKASPTTYDTHVEARWTDGFNVTLGHKGKAKFTRDIQRVG